MSHKQPTNIVTNKDLPKFFNFAETFGKRFPPMRYGLTEGGLEFRLVQNGVAGALDACRIIFCSARSYLTVDSCLSTYFFCEFIPGAPAFVGVVV